jgi:hypothetical protein
MFLHDIILVYYAYLINSPGINSVSLQSTGRQTFIVHHKRFKFNKVLDSCLDHPKTQPTASHHPVRIRPISGY